MNGMLGVLPDALMASMVSFLVAAVAAPIVYKVLVRANSRQVVSEYVPEHAGKQGTPTMGGIIVVVSVLAAMLVISHGKFDFVRLTFIWFALIGFLDDFLVPKIVKGKRGLGWMAKLGLQALPFLYLAVFDRTLSIEGIAVWALIVLFFANAYNFADGMDGLAGGLGIILALTFVAIWVAVEVVVPTIGGLNDWFVPEMLALACALVPFLFLNAPPAKVFMGDVGSLPIGALLGFAFVMLPGIGGKGYVLQGLEIWPLFLPLIVLAVEIVPVPLQIASAKLRKGKRLFPFRTPVHHAFEAAGWPETRVVSLFLLTQLVASGIAMWLLCWELRGKA